MRDPADVSGAGVAHPAAAEGAPVPTPKDGGSMVVSHRYRAGLPALKNELAERTRILMPWVQRAAPAWLVDTCSIISDA